MIYGERRVVERKKNLRFTIMKRGYHIVLVGITTALVLLACSRGGSGAIDDGGGPHIINNNDSVAPVVEIFTPTELQVFVSGNTISVTGKITDAGGLYRGTIKVVNDANGGVVKEQLYERHGFQAYNFNLSHEIFVTTASNFTVTVSFEDHGSNITSKSVKIKVNP
jgi:hypothetical protein